MQMWVNIPQCFHPNRQFSHLIGYTRGVQQGRVPVLGTLLSVSFQHVGEAETLAAYFTGVRLLSCVCTPVPLHIRTTCEALPTDLTYIWFLSCVCLHVLIEILFHIEVLPTALTHKLLVSDVDAQVRAQLVLVLKSLTADLTLERLLS